MIYWLIFFSFSGNRKRRWFRRFRPGSRGALSKPIRKRATTKVTWIPRFFPGGCRPAAIRKKRPTRKWNRSCGFRKRRMRRKWEIAGIEWQRNRLRPVNLTRCLSLKDLHDQLFSMKDRCCWNATRRWRNRRSSSSAKRLVLPSNPLALW